MEDYEKKYKEALTKSKEFYEKCKQCGAKITEDFLKNAFPELAESEDERVRKALVRFHKSIIDIDGIKGTDILAWLEKQGEQKSIMNVPTREVILSIWDLGNEWKELTNGSISTEYGTQLDYIQKHWYESEYYLREKQNEQKPILDFKASNWYVSKVDGKIHDMTYNPTDKVEPKFKVGDWVVNNNSGGVHQVTEIRDDEYCLWPLYGEICGYLRIIDVDTEYHLWTIQDAKDGDILAGKINGDSYILICKQIKDGWIETYGHYYDAVDRFCVPSQLFCRDYHGSFVPATKEQEELLLSKMKEGGYEFDFDKKDLKKIEQKPTWSSEDKSALEDIEEAITNYWHGDTQDILLDWLKRLKDRIGG